MSPRNRIQLWTAGEKSLCIPDNIFLVCSISGKLEKRLMKEWANDCLSQVTEEPFVLLLDSWSGQTDDSVFNSLVQRCKKVQIPP